MTAGVIHLNRTIEITEMFQHEDHMHQGETYDLVLDVIVWNDGSRTVMRKP